MGLLEILGLSAAFAARDAYKEEKKDRQRRADFEARTGAELDEQWNVLSAATEPPSTSKIQELRSLYSSVKHTCDPLDEGDICSAIGYPGRNLADMFETDIVRFLLHIALADAPVNSSESSFMNAIVGSNRSASEWEAVAMRLQANSFAVTAEVPFSFQVMNYIAVASGSDAKGILASLLDGLGTAMIKSDGQMTQEELDRTEAYLDNVRWNLGPASQNMTPPSYPLFLD